MVQTATDYQIQVAGNPIITIFGDTILPIDITNEMEIVEFGNEFLTNFSLTSAEEAEFTAIALVDGNMRFFGDCVEREPECKVVESLPADMIDFEFFSLQRYKRQ